MPGIRRPEPAEIEAAAERLRGVAVRTPLVPLHGPDADPRILLKPETHQVVGSFKIRGVLNAVASLEPGARSRGISTVSAGNTAQALAAFDGLAPAEPLSALCKAWTLQQNLTQLLKVALGDQSDPSEEPKAFRALLARAGGARDFRSLRVRLETARKGAREAYEAIVET